MDRQEADERYVRLLENVAAARALLNRIGEDHWSGWMATVYAELRSLDAYGLTRLLGAYGGMGSLNDLVIHPVNGHSIPEDEVDRVNGSLDACRTALHADATALRNDLERTQRSARTCRWSLDACGGDWYSGFVRHVPPSRYTIVTCNVVCMTVKHRVSEYRRRMRARGLRPVQIWVPDVRSERFAQEAERQAALVARADQLSDDQEFVEAVTDSWDEE